MSRRLGHFRTAVFAVVSCGLFSTWAPGAPVSDEPIITEPASNAVLNAALVFVQWAEKPHARYQVRVNRVNDPDSGIVWDSGEVTSGRNYAWTGPLPDQTRCFVHVRVGSTNSWGPWSARGHSFSINTTAPSGGANLVRVQGHSLRDNAGPFLGLGVTYFQALRLAKYDRARLNADLALLASKGFNYVRILTMVSWDGLEIAPVSFTNRAGHAVQAWPDYWSQFREMLDIVARHGMRSEVTIFADAQRIMLAKSAREAHLNGILTNIIDREHQVLHLEVANEAWQNGFPGSQGIADLREFAQYLADRTSVPVAITSNDTGDAGITSLNRGSAADLATVHFSRHIGSREGGWLPVRDCYRAGQLPGVPPVTSNEPIGPGSSVSSENDPIKLCAAAVFAYIANLPAYVYHSRAGVSGYVKCCPPSSGEVRFENTAGINAYQHLRQILPPDLASWVRNDGLEPDAPFTVSCNGQANRYWPDVTGATNGCNRNIGSAKGREFVCFPMGILSGGVTLQARRAIRFRVFNPLTGAVFSNFTLNAGHSITLPQGPGAFILKGSFSDTNPSSATRQKTETFDRDPKWEGKQNRPSPIPPSLVAQDFGYSATHHAGKAAGEIGGRVSQSIRPAYYGKVVPAGTFEEPLSASGTLSVLEAQSIMGWHTQGNIYVGWFNSDVRDLIWRPRNFIGFRLLSSNEPDGALVELTYGTRAWQAGGMFVNAGGGGQERLVRELSSATLLRIPPDGSKHSWTCVYDPAAAKGGGEIIFTFDGAESRLAIAPELRKAGGSFNRFGIFAPRIPGRHLVAYFDDLTLNGRPEDFTRDPQWEGVGNRERFRDPAPYGHNDFGFSASHYAGGRMGELGGRFFSCNPGEDEFKGHYGDDVGNLTLHHRLSARGRFMAKEFSIDSSFALGWFNARKQGWPVENFVGVYFDSLSSDGRIAAPLYGTSRGNKREQSGLLIFEPGKPYDWILDYDPAAADDRGTITFTLADKSVTLPLRDGDKAAGASLNRFGVFNLQWANSKWCEVYLDDLSYTASTDAP